MVSFSLKELYYTRFTDSLDGNVMYVDLNLKSTVRNVHGTMTRYINSDRVLCLYIVENDEQGQVKNRCCILQFVVQFQIDVKNLLQRDIAYKQYQIWNSW